MATIVITGQPCSGKSTYISNELKTHENTMSKNPSHDSRIYHFISGIKYLGIFKAEQLLIWLIAGTILFFTWAPLDNFILSIMRNDWFCGFISGFAGVFIGANGPLVTSYMRTKNLSPEVLVANHGAVMIFQHSLRIILFIYFFSFSLLEYLLFIFALAVAGYAGALLGKKLISYISYEKFYIFLKLLLSALALILLF